MSDKYKLFYSDEWLKKASLPDIKRRMEIQCCKLEEQEQRAEEAEARVKELEHYEYMINYTIDFAPPHISNEVKKELSRFKKEAGE